MEGTWNLSVEFTWLAKGKNSIESRGQALYLSLGCLTETQALPKRCLLLRCHVQFGFQRTFLTLNQQISLLLPSFKAASCDYPPRFQSRQNCPWATLKCVRTFLLAGSWWNWIISPTWFCEIWACAFSNRLVFGGERFDPEETRKSKERCASHRGLPVPWQRCGPKKQCTNLSSDGTCLYLWFARTICTLRLTGAQLTITDNISPSSYEWVPSLLKCTDQITLKVLRAKWAYFM